MINNNELFYQQCAKILKCEHVDGSFKHRYRTRWNNRTPGSGRFPGRGIIRCFGDAVHIALTFPICINTICESKADALITLTKGIPYDH